MKFVFSPDIIPSGWLGSKHQLASYSRRPTRIDLSVFFHCHWCCYSIAVVYFWSLLRYEDVPTSKCAFWMLLLLFIHLFSACLYLCLSLPSPLSSLPLSLPRPPPSLALSPFFFTPPPHSFSLCSPVFALAVIWHSGHLAACLKRLKRRDQWLV